MQFCSGDRPETTTIELPRFLARIRPIISIPSISGRFKLGQNHRWAKYFGLHYSRSGRRYFAQKVIAG